VLTLPPRPWVWNYQEEEMARQKEEEAVAMDRQQAKVQITLRITLRFLSSMKHPSYLNQQHHTLSLSLGLSIPISHCSTLQHTATH